MKQYDARTADEIQIVSGRLHDSWLEVPDEVIVRNGEFVLTGVDDFGFEIERPPYRTWGPFTRSHKLRRELMLTVRHVQTVEIEDEAKIGDVSVSALRYDPSASTLKIVGNTPTEVTMRVDAIDVTLVVTDRTRRRGRRWGLHLRGK